MRLNFAVIFTFILLSLMVSAGVISSAWGYRLGREALKGITQPDTRPTNNMARRNGGSAQGNNLVFLKEEDILAEVKARMEGKTGPITAQRQAQAQAAAPAEPAPAESPTAAEPAAGLPLKAADQGVELEVRQVRRQGANLVLDVALQNQSDRDIEFLYSFMNVTDDQGQALSVSTEGLPTELLSKSEVVTGEVRVPADAIEQAETLSLTLTDYPDQRLRLEMSGIPVAQ
jgi:hypothetical protein